VFARLADGNQPPVRKIEGQATRLGRTMHSISYDAMHDEFLVTQPFSQAVLVFRGDSSGEVAPIRTIQGPLTRLEDPDKADVDPVNNEIIVPDGDKILIFPRTANGNVAPIRVIEGPDTMLGAEAAAVDEVNNILAVTGYAGRRENGDSFILVFNRTDSGNAKPRAVIRGPRTGINGTFGIQTYAPKGWIILANSGPNYSLDYDASFVGIWSFRDNGNVPPRWTIGGPFQILKQPRGMDVDVANKTILISDKRLNAVLTYSFPEIF
jgi:hypothetical protein